MAANAIQRKTMMPKVGDGSRLAKLLPTTVIRTGQVQQEADRLADGVASGVGHATAIGLGVIASIHQTLQAAADKVAEVKA